MSQSPATAATMDGELVNSEGTQEGKNTSHLVANTAATHYGEPEETKDVKKTQEIGPQ